MRAGWLRAGGITGALALAAAAVAAAAVVAAPRADAGEGEGEGEGAARFFEVPREGALDPSARSWVVRDAQGAAVMTEPAGGAPLAGRTATEVSFPVLEARRGPGCRRLWVRIGPGAWACGDRGELSSAAPHAPAQDEPRVNGAPWSFAFTARDGVRAYRTLDAALAGSDAPSTYEPWEANWGFAVGEVLGEGAARVVQTRSGYFLRRGDLYRATLSDFSGGSFSELSGGAPGVPFGWVAQGGTFAYPEPSEEGAGETVRRLSRVHVYATREGSRGRVFARIGPGRWVRADHLRWVLPAPPPPEVNAPAGERWIDVDLSSQTLIAYEGTRPVYATMVSTGGERTPTEPGVFRVWGRYVAHTMDNTESAHLPNHFRLGDVPYVQFFDGDRGLHAVYWHDEFGVARSHGCVNLAPRDAAFLFRFTAQPLPPGWVSRMMPARQGTVVRVRGRYPG